MPVAWCCYALITDFDIPLMSRILTQEKCIQCWCGSTTTLDKIGVRKIQFFQGNGLLCTCVCDWTKRGMCSENLSQVYVHFWGSSLRWHGCSASVFRAPCAEWGLCADFSPLVVLLLRDLQYDGRDDCASVLLNVQDEVCVLTFSTFEKRTFESQVQWQGLLRECVWGRECLLLYKLAT